MRVTHRKGGEGNRQSHLLVAVLLLDTFLWKPGLGEGRSLLQEPRMRDPAVFTKR